MIGHVPVALALAQKVEVGPDQGRSSPQEERNLPNLEFLCGELGAACEGGQIVGDRLGRVMHDLADLRGGLALEGKSDDLRAMGEHRSEIVERAPHRDQDVGMRLRGTTRKSREMVRGVTKKTRYARSSEVRSPP